MADISKITILDGTTYNIKDPSKVNKTGDTMTGNLIVPATRIANTYYGISFGRTTSTPVETILYSGIKWKSGSHMPVVHITGYAYGLASPVEFKIGFYIYADKIGYCGVTNMGSWNPQVFLFKYTNTDSVDCVAIGLKGSCYFLQLQADIQDEMGKFNNVITDSTKWSWSFLTTTGTIPEPDGGTSCIEVPYKADILNPKKVNGYTVNSSVPSNAKFTDTTALGSMTGTLGVDHGGTGKTNAIDAANVLMNALSTGSSTPVDADQYISQYVGGGTTTTTYHRRPMSALWEYVKGKISSVLGLTASSYGGSAAKVNNHTVAVDVPSGAKFTDTTYESKAAASGGTAVSLVTTGEKYTWNNKGTYSKPSGGIPDSDIASAATWNAKGNGTITGITMNGASKGTSGIVDLGTVLTTHQSLAGKQDKITASGILKGNGSGGVSAAVAGTDYLTPATNYSPTKEISGNYTLITSDIGKTLAATTNGTTITIPLDVWTSLPFGAEIAFFRYALQTNVNLIVDCTAITGLRGCINGTPTAFKKFKINNGYDLVVLKKLNSGNSYGMVAGNVEVVS